MQPRPQPRHSSVNRASGGNVCARAETREQIGVMGTGERDQSPSQRKTAHSGGPLKCWVFVVFFFHLITHCYREPYLL